MNNVDASNAALVPALRARLRVLGEMFLWPSVHLVGVLDTSVGRSMSLSNSHLGFV